MLTLRKSNTTALELLRTYNSGGNESTKCSIWQTARATSAAPFFKKVELEGRGGISAKYIDPGNNNSPKELLKEAKRVFSPDRKVRCILSLGTGQDGPVGLRGESGAFALDLVDLVKSLATDCENTHRELEARLKDHGVYFRLNLDQGAQSMRLEDRDKIEQLDADVKSYMAREPAKSHIERVAHLPCSKGNDGTLLTLREVFGDM